VPPSSTPVRTEAWSTREFWGGVLVKAWPVSRAGRWKSVAPAWPLCPPHPGSIFSVALFTPMS
jgi:hypothetical protein